jgi:hypothetical protein
VNELDAILRPDIFRDWCIYCATFCDHQFGMTRMSMVCRKCGEDTNVGKRGY